MILHDTTLYKFTHVTLKNIQIQTDQNPNKQTSVTKTQSLGCIYENIHRIVNIDRCIFENCT